MAGKMRKIRPLIYGVGINDAPFPTSNTNPIYKVWKSMFTRAYCPKYQKKKPSYKNTTVCKEWHSFMNFYIWASTRYKAGLVLDKDLTILGNKEYSPKSARFVSKTLNNIIHQFHKNAGIQCRNGKYRAYCRTENKRKYLGIFDTKLDAHRAYLQAKAQHVDKVLQTDPTVTPEISNNIRHLIATAKGSFA